MDIKGKFLSNGIPFDELDPEMIQLVDILNFDLGLITTHCCFGHSNGEELYVSFDECIEDGEINEVNQTPC